MTGVQQARARGLRRWAIDLRPLSVPAYRRVWLGNGVAMFGFQFTAVAVPVEMYDLTTDSFWVGLLGVAGFVPLLIFGLWGGAVADARDRRKVLLAAGALLWASTLGLLAQSLFQVGSPVLLLVLVAVQSVAFAITSPARSAILPKLVPDELVPAASTLNYTTFTAASVVGPLAAGLIFAAWKTDVGLPVAYAVDALLFTVSLWATLRLPALPPEPDPDGDGTPRKAGLASVVDGFRYLATTPVLLLSFAVDLIAMILAMPRALFPEIAHERFAGAGAVGWLYSAIAIGSMIGGLTSGWIGRIRRQGLGLVLAVVAWGVAIAAAGFAHQLWLMVLLLGVAGAADLVSAVLRQTMLLVYAPDRMRGRLQGVNTVVVAGGPRLGDLRAGTTAAAFGGGVAWIAGGAASAVLVILLAVAFPALLRYRSATTAGGDAAAPDGGRAAGGGEPSGASGDGRVAAASDDGRAATSGNGRRTTSGNGRRTTGSGGDRATASRGDRD